MRFTLIILLPLSAAGLLFALVPWWRPLARRCNAISIVRITQHLFQRLL